MRVVGVRTAPSVTMKTLYDEPSVIKPSRSRRIGRAPESKLVGLKLREVEVHAAVVLDLGVEGLGVVRLRSGYHGLQTVVGGVVTGEVEG